MSFDSDRSSDERPPLRRDLFLPSVGDTNSEDAIYSVHNRPENPTIDPKLLEQRPEDGKSTSAMRNNHTWETLASGSQAQAAVENFAADPEIIMSPSGPGQLDNWQRDQYSSGDSSQSSAVPAGGEEPPTESQPELGEIALRPSTWVRPIGRRQRVPCPLCNSTFTSDKDLRRHGREIHGINSWLPFRCRCGKTKPRKDNHDKHVQRCRGKSDDLGLYVCHCGKQSELLDEHLEHIGRIMPDKGCEDLVD